MCDETVNFSTLATRVLKLDAYIGKQLNLPIKILRGLAPLSGSFLVVVFVVKKMPFFLSFLTAIFVVVPIVDILAPVYPRNFAIISGQ